LMALAKPISPKKIARMGIRGRPCCRRRRRSSQCVGDAGGCSDRPGDRANALILCRPSCDLGVHFFERRSGVWFSEVIVAGRSNVDGTVVSRWSSGSLPVNLGSQKASCQHNRFVRVKFIFEKLRLISTRATWQRSLFSKWNKRKKIFFFSLWERLLHDRLS
jgi:hypothetical protein